MIFCNRFLFVKCVEYCIIVMHFDHIMIMMIMIMVIQSRESSQCSFIILQLTIVNASAFVLTKG